MTQTYIKRNIQDAAPEPWHASVPQGPSIAELARGAAPTEAQMGHRVDLPGEIREKMESSFGVDFSGVRLYESDTVAEAGANAVARGNSIAFAPGKLDFSSTAGQALLGHELSHVVSQARGESVGRGLLNNAALEAQADRQGMMAAQGQSVYAGPVTPVGVSSASAASGPMQASKAENNALAQREARLQGSTDTLPDGFLRQRRFRNTWLRARNQRHNSPFYQIYNEQVGNDTDSDRMNFLYDAIHSTINRGNDQTAANINSEARMAMTELAMEIQASGDNERIGEFEDYVGDMLIGRGSAAEDFMQSYNNNNQYMDGRYLEILADNDALGAISAGIGSGAFTNIENNRDELNDAMNRSVSDFNNAFGQAGVPQNFSHEPDNVSSNRDWLVSNVNNRAAQSAVPSDPRAARIQAMHERHAEIRERRAAARRARNTGGRPGILSRLAASVRRHTRLD